MLEREIRDRYRFWLESPIFDNEIKQELTGLSEEEIYDRFYCDLEFGTSGVRGILGAGTNRMNKYLIRRLSWSLGETILREGIAEKGVVIAGDPRRCSDEFCLETALVLAAQGIKVYLFDALRPTPELSFAVRHLGCAAGVMITASHNPKEYNGYKVYGDDGAQLSPFYADQMTDILNRCPWEVKTASREEAIACGLLEIIGEDVDREYLECVKNELLEADLIKEHGGEMKIVFTPLHGTGRVPVQQVLAEAGFADVTTVREQEMPDTEFSTVASPNPEDKGAWDLALRYAGEQGSELLLATDPDADRLGVQCRKEDGNYHHFTGNQIGILLTNYILEALEEKSGLPEDGVVIQNVVSTAFTEKLAEKFGVERRIVPVGFKFIGEQIKEMETAGKGTFLFGFEESIGYLKGTYARDKDAVAAAALVAEAALYYKVKHGKSLYAVLQELFDEYGCFVDQQVSMKFEGAAGKQKIAELLGTLENETPDVIAGQKVVRRWRDGNMVCIGLENGGFIKGRPSGTEPKVRLYFCIGSADQTCAYSEMEQAKKEILELIG